MIVTRPDSDRAVDRDAIDEHSTALVAEKARRDQASFLQMQAQPLGMAETVALLLAVGGLLALGIWLVIAIAG